MHDVLRLMLVACCLQTLHGAGVQPASVGSTWPPPAAVRWRLLSDNAHYRGPALPTGVTYAWERPPTNPGDTSGRRLLDGDQPADWNSTTGWNQQDNAAIFDFQRPYRFAHAEFRFDQALPASVEIQARATSLSEAASWTPVARMVSLSNGWNSVPIPEAPLARHLRVAIRWNGWGVYFREARFYGVPEGERRPVPPSPLTEDNRMVLVKKGRPHVAIVVDSGANQEARHAAWVLRDTILTMTGGEIPIFAASENPTGARILVGASGPAQAAGVVVPQSDRPGAERYRIQTVGKDVVLVGNDAGGYRGTTHAVYDLLQRLGCGWFGPEPLYQVIPRHPTLSVPPLNVDESPDFDMRSIWMVRDPVLQDAWRVGGFHVDTAHILNALVPESLRTEHPDWFGPGQPCLTHPGVRNHIVNQFRQHLDANPNSFRSLSIGQVDTDKFCQCESCRTAGNFSARYLKFANSIADVLRESHPGRFQLGFLAYWVTHEAPNPRVEGRPEVTVLIVNEGDHTKPVDQPESTENARRGRSNLRERQAIEQWLPSGSLKGVYEWWIPACGNPAWQGVPWYSGETVMRNLRYWKKLGFRYLTYETGYEAGNGFPLRWPLYYVAARGTWDSELTAKEIMDEACAKLFGAAAAPMARFYATLEGAMLDTPHPGGNWHLPSAELIYTPQIEARATLCLDQAVAIRTLPEEQARIASERALWNRARATLATLRTAQDAGVFAVRLDRERGERQTP